MGADADKDSSLKSTLETVFGRFLRRDLTIEKLRWRFLATYKASEVKLWESPGVLMAQAPRAAMTVSWKTLFTGRLHIGRMRFKDATATFRFDHNGHSNLTDMIRDLVTFARENRKPGQRQKVVYNVFQIDNAKLDIVDTSTNIKPFRTPFVINAKGDINGLGPKTKFPFHLDAVQTSTGSAMHAKIWGTMSSQPIIHASAARVPLDVISDYLPVVRWFQGTTDARFDFSKGGCYRFWKVTFANDAIRLTLPYAFPLLRVDGFFHAHIPSRLKIKLEGKQSHVDVLLTILGFRSKKVALVVNSSDLAIEEFIQWCRTAMILNNAQSDGSVPTGGSVPLPVWKVTGQADVRAELNSVMGPQLIRRAAGKIQFQIRDGVLSDMPGFVKMISMLNLSSFLSAAQAKPEGLAFGTVNGTIDIKDGAAQTRGLIFLEGNTLDIGVIGRVNFAKQAINVRMLVGIVSVPENVIAKIPFVRRFGPKQVGVIPIWLAIQGPFRKPVVRVLSLKTFDPQLWKTLPPGLRIPEEEIKKIYQ